MWDRIEGAIVYGLLLIVVAMFSYLAHAYYVGQTAEIRLTPGINPQGVANHSGD